MKNTFYLLLFFAALVLATACNHNQQQSLTVSSPAGKVKLSVSLNAQDIPVFQLWLNGKLALDSSLLGGFDLRNAPALRGPWQITGHQTTSFSETWQPVWGQSKDIKNNYEELRLSLKEKNEPNRLMNLVFRVYDDGLGFRYEVPQQAGLDSVVIMDEHTQFQLTGDHLTWWQPGDWDIYEHLYNTTPFTKIDALSKRNHPDLAQTYIPENAVNTPVTQKTKEGMYLAFHEAALYNFSAMTLKVDKENLRWVSELVGSPDESKVKTKTPFQTPWRTIQLGEKAADLLSSNLILNLNEPNKIADVSWIKPTKYVGIWWEMHLNKSTWAMEGGKHGATTANAKRYIDFASANGIPAMLVEGWNTGWEHWIGFEDREGVFDFVTPYPDYDLAEVVRYGKEKGVNVIMHHETSSAPRTYDQQLDTAFALCQQLGIHAIKTGYVGKIIPKNEYHQGQWMINHYQRVLEKAAAHQIMVDAHETVKGTGIQRTWPNFMARETMRGQEFEAWSTDMNPPEHLVILPFTMGLGSGLDYTPGIFDIKFDDYKDKNQVNTTIAKQLALYITLYSPLQMAADLPENYEGNPALQFIKDVAVDWDETRVLNAEVGDFLTIARKAKGKDEWFLGSATDENPRDFEVSLDFLSSGVNYQAQIYADAADAHWDKNPVSVSISQQNVSSKDKLKLKLAPGGGVAIRFVKR